MTIKYATKSSDESIALLRDIAGGLTFGDLVRAERERLELTMSELGEKLGVSRQYINSLEKGLKFPSVEQAIKFADAVGKSPEIYIQLALQSQVDRAGAKYSVRVIGI